MPKASRFVVPVLACLLAAALPAAAQDVAFTFKRAYRDVLGRDPDPAGYANYERLMRERGYTERDIRRALMNGEEYRAKMRSQR